MRLAILFSTCVLLAGCSTQHSASETAAQKAQRAAAQDQADDAQCRRYDVVPGSDAYAQCRTVLKKGRFDDDPMVRD
jgi:outer membrane biogenesis lipoprotein LolB